MFNVLSNLLVIDEKFVVVPADVPLIYIVELILVSMYVIKYNVPVERALDAM